MSTHCIGNVDTASPACAYDATEERTVEHVVMHLCPRHALLLDAESGVTMSEDARSSVEESGVVVVEDVRRLLWGEVTFDALLEECLDGVEHGDSARADSWRSYVDALSIHTWPVLRGGHQNARAMTEEMQ